MLTFAVLALGRGPLFFVLSLLRFAIHEANYDICIINIVQTLWIG